MRFLTSFADALLAQLVTQSFFAWREIIADFYQGVLLTSKNFKLVFIHTTNFTDNVSHRTILRVYKYIGNKVTLIVCA